MVDVTFTINNKQIVIDVDIAEMTRICEEVARSAATIYYSRLAERLGMPPLTNHNELGEPLDIMNKEDLKRDPNAPLISAVVVHKSDLLYGGDKLPMPGDGFFKLAKELGRMRTDQDKKEFWYAELRRVHEYWRNR